MKLFVFTFTHETERGIETKSISFGESIMSKIAETIENQTGDRNVNIMGAMQVFKPSADEYPERKNKEYCETLVSS